MRIYTPGTHNDSVIISEAENQRSSKEQRAIRHFQIIPTLNKLTESTCKLFPFGCLIIQYAFKEHGDERRKILLSNITILARTSTLSVFKECLGRLNLHKKKEHYLIQVIKIAKLLLILCAIRLFVSNVKKRNKPISCLNFKQKQRNFTKAQTEYV